MAKLRSSASLRTTLRPLTRLTFVCGILPNWFHPGQIGRVGSALSWIAVSLTAILQVGMAVFQVVQVTIPLSNHPTIHSITSSLLFLLPSYACLFIQIEYTIKARSLRDLLRDWRELEGRLGSVASTTRVAFVRAFVYGTTLFETILTTLSLISVLTDDEGESYLLSYYSFFRQPDQYRITTAVHLTVVLVQKVLSSVSSLVPAFFFYHVSLTVRALSDQIESRHPATVSVRSAADAEPVAPLANSGSQRQIQSLRSNYNQLRKLVKRANGLFGPLMIVSHAFKFFFICLASYHILYGLLHSSGDFVVYLVNLAFFVTELVSSVLMASQLKRAVRDFRGKYCDFVVDGWSSLSLDEKKNARRVLERAASEPTDRKSVGPLRRRSGAAAAHPRPRHHLRHPPSAVEMNRHRFYLIGLECHYHHTFFSSVTCSTFV